MFPPPKKRKKRKEKRKKTRERREKGSCGEANVSFWAVVQVTIILATILALII